jgi:hypothetical protein
MMRQILHDGHLRPWLPSPLSITEDALPPVGHADRPAHERILAYRRQLDAILEQQEARAAT